jgi:hypothetical protein
MIAAAGQPDQQGDGGDIRIDARDVNGTTSLLRAWSLCLYEQHPAARWRRPPWRRFRQALTRVVMKYAESIWRVEEGEGGR